MKITNGWHTKSIKLYELEHYEKLGYKEVIDETKKVKNKKILKEGE